MRRSTTAAARGRGHCARYGQSAVTAATPREVIGLGRQKIARFVSLGLLTESEPGSYEIEEWTKFQQADPIAAERKARWRARAATTSAEERWTGSNPYRPSL